MAAHRALARELGADGGYHEGGSLEWSEGGDAERELRTRVARLASRGYSTTLIGRDEAQDHEPALTIPDHVKEVAFYEAEGWLDVPRAISRLLGASGAEVRQGTHVRSFRKRNDRVEAVVLDEGEIEAESVLVCVGPGTQAFLATLGVAIPVGRVPGLLAVTSRPAQAL